MVKAGLRGECPAHHVKTRQAGIMTVIGLAIGLVLLPRATMAGAMLSLQLTQAKNWRATK